VRAMEAMNAQSWVFVCATDGTVIGFIRFDRRTSRNHVSRVLLVHLKLRNDPKGRRREALTKASLLEGCRARRATASAGLPEPEGRRAMPLLPVNVSGS